jgi:hypothetical protein
VDGGQAVEERAQAENERITLVMTQRARWEDRYMSERIVPE